MRKRKKYGTGTAVKGVFKDPQEVLAQNDINIAEAKYTANSNPIHMALNAVGGILMEKGISSLAGMSWDDISVDGGGDVGTPNVGWAMGGTTGKNVEAEVEGKEVIQTPGGEAIKMVGPSHKEGGIKGKLPEGTKVFSTQFKIKGKTPAERKMAREKRIKKVQDELSKNPSDQIIKDTLKRTELANATEEKSDMRMQEIVKSLDGLTEFVTGSAGKKKFFWGGTALNQGTTSETDIEEEEETGATLPWGYGDMAGMFGTAVSGFGPMLNTMRSRAGDTVNTNQYEGFGDDAIEANLEAQSKVDSIKDNQKQDLQLKRNTSIKRNRNKVRSLNSLTALDTTVDMGINADMRKIYNDWANQIMQLTDRQSNLEMAQDQGVMAGKAQADLANRQDKDAYDTAMGADIANLGTAFQKLGSDFNQHKGNKDFMDILPDVSMYGLGYEYVNGKLTLKKVKD